MMNITGKHLDFNETDSKEETYFSWWLCDAYNKGIITTVHFHDVEFRLFNMVQLPYTKQLKTMTKTDHFSILNKVDYTPDFIIEWNPEYLNKLFLCYDDPRAQITCAKKPSHIPFLATDGVNGYISYIDIKGKFAGRNNASAITFPLKQKILWDKKRIFINKVVVPDIFTKTFAPERYLFTDKSGKPRKLKGQIITIDNFIAYL